MNVSRRAGLFGLLLAACASSEPSSPSEFDRSAGEARVVIGPDGFGTLDGQRMPFEAIVVRLRLRTRALGVEAMSRFVVALGVQPEVQDVDAVQRMQADFDRMLVQLDVMDVEHVELITGAGR
jgi:hypothetical protein